jgi:hypothetical protein
MIFFMMVLQNGEALSHFKRLPKGISLRTDDPVEVRNARQCEFVDPSGAGAEKE